jgi:hypothetical protein
MSLGRTCEAPSPLDPAMQQAINLAWDAGVLIVAAAGNDGTSNLHCPASADNTIAVSATYNNDVLSDFSTFGNFIDLAALGGNLNPVHVIYNVEGNTGNGYVGWIGTSFSSPIVAGLAGLVWSANMSLSNSQVDQILRNTADNIGSSFFFGDGRVNANAAVLAAEGPPPPTPTPTPPPAANPVLQGLNPNLAGQINTITVTGATPGSTVFFGYSQNTGTTVISGGACNGQSLGLNNAIILGTVIANGSGTAIYNVNVPSSFNGITVHLQAYAQTASTCGISNRVTQTVGSVPTPTPAPTPAPTPTPPPAANPVLQGLNPNIAGQNNTITVTGATPGSAVFFRYSQSTGTTVISGGACNGQSLGLNNAIVLGTVIANASGTAVLNVFVPGGFFGITVHIQSYTETATTCGISNRVTQTVQ